MDRVDQLLLMFNLLLLGSVSFLPLPTRLVAEHTRGADANTAAVLYCGTLTMSAVAFNLIWRRAARRNLFLEATSAEFVRDVDVRYLLGLAAYAVATLLALVAPTAAIVLTVVLALMFALGPSPRPGKSTLRPELPAEQ